MSTTVRYEPVPGSRNLFRDHGRKGSPYVLRWKQDGRKREKVIGCIKEKDARRVRDAHFATPEEERTTTSTVRCGTVYETWIAAGLKARGQGKLGPATIARYKGL